MPKSLVLTGLTGGRVGIRTVLSGRINIVGSNTGCDLILPEAMIVPRHAEIRYVLERWFIVPLDAHARIFINGEPVTSQGRILEGDLVTFGSVTFKASFTEIVEQELGASTKSDKQGVPRLGEYLTQRGVVSANQVMQAVQRQEDLRRQGRRVQIGDLLCEMGYISRTQLEQALQDQRKDFFERFRD